ncbi:hypothetical protein BJ165DRAFT_1081353 [Panaeolus papilionaceus]|nr:hypothetical protein BJ165DRAFT_1081353 [Panaeolus papilionaceus]
MSLARRAVFSASRLPHEEHDSTVYPAEGFGNAFWRNVVLISLAGVAAVKFAPAANDEVYLTRWIAMYSSPRDYWLELNAKHTAQQAKVSEDHLLVSDAHRPAVHRFRYPQAMVQASPFLNPVGMNVQVEDTVIKGDKDIL